jgi:DNA polymerase III epsilon subunit-like protein
MNDYSLYFLDCESSSLDSITGDVIELSILRIANDDQKTWCLKPFNFDGIETAALRINGHKLEDITHQTKFGKETYLDPHKVIVEIENWLAEDDCPTSNRVLVAHNAAFDRDFLLQLWKKCGSEDSFPFGRRYLDTMQIEFFLSLCSNEMLEGYSLANLSKKYGIKNEKAHSAAADTLTGKLVFDKQVEAFKKALIK